MAIEDDLRAARTAAARAAQMIREEYTRWQALVSAPADISTHVDRASQECILQYLREVFPDDALCAEEDTPTLATAPRTGRRVWVVDPIDGTRGFATKNGEFSVMIALLEYGQVRVGVVNEPAFHRETYAHVGGGCWRQDGDKPPVRCQVLTNAQISDSILVQSHAKPPGKPNCPGAWKSVRETYSGGVKLALVARAEVDVYVNTYAAFADWDIAAGHILVTEAGGCVTQISGQPIEYLRPDFRQRGGLIASNGPLHPAVLAAMSG